MTLLGLQVHRKIHTGEKQVPWSSVFILAMMWFTWGFNLFAAGPALTFTIRKYSSNPQIIALVMTAGSIFMLGPFISYISDQVWTRSGRRRPFLIVAWLGGCLGMTAFAYLPQVGGAINHILAAMHLPPVGDLLVLGIVIACYLKMWDGAAPLEPLFLECVPAHQRGRFWAMRGMLFAFAVTMFYQILWPVFDRNIDMFDYRIPWCPWLGYPGILYMTGEKCIYILAAGLFFFTGIFVVFGVEETRFSDAPNLSFRKLFLGGRNQIGQMPREPVLPVIEIKPAAKILDYGLPRARESVLSTRIRDIPILGFFFSFYKDVFVRIENYTYYIVLIIPGIETMVWGNFGQLMQNDQFHYTKDVQAGWAFPMQIMSTFLLPVFAGWYSDVRSNVRWWLRILMLILSAASFVAMLWMLKTYSPSDIRALPSFLVLSVVTGLTALSMVMLYIPMVETMLDYVGREHARAYVSLLTVVKSMITVGLLYVLLQGARDQTLPIMVWMVFAVVGATLGALMDTFIGPMIYDYMPPSQMGTINSGKGIIESLIKFCALNIGAWWVVYFSTHIHKPVNVKYDYTSMYILQFALFVPAIIAKLYFIHLIRTGKMKKLGTAKTEVPTDIVIEEKLTQMEVAGAQ